MENKTPATPAVRERIVSILQDEMGYLSECLRPETNFENDLGMDSMECLELIALVELEFGIEIPDAEAEKINTIGDLVQWVETKTGVA